MELALQLIKLTNNLIQFSRKLLDTLQLNWRPF